MQKFFLSIVIFAFFNFFTGCADSLEKKLNKLHSSLEALKLKLSSLSDELGLIKDKLTSVATEELITIEKVADKFKVDLTALKNRYSKANFYEYANKVGGWKTVILVRIDDGNAFVLGKCAPEYKDNYNKIKDKQKRPNIDFFTLPSRKSGKPNIQMKAAEFMGSQGINPLDSSQIKQLAEMGMAFTQENDSFDPNPGNILIKDGKLFYIDQDLTYASEETWCLNLLKNIGASIEIATSFLPGASQEELKNIFITILDAYKNEISKIDVTTLEKFKNDYEKSKNFKDRWGNEVTFEKELNSMARRTSYNLGNESKAWDAPLTVLEMFIIKHLKKVFNLFEK